MNKKTNRLAEELIRSEALRLKPYRCTAGKLTIGVGRNIEENGITRDEAIYLLNNDIERCEARLNKLPWYVKLNRPRQEAMIRMVFNLGLTRFFKFRKMILAMKHEDWDMAACQALDSLWARQVGKRAMRIARVIQCGTYEV
jgi:lysozyme